MKRKVLIKSLVTLMVGAALGAAVSISVLKNRNSQTLLAPSETRVLIPMKVYQQETEYSCGGATVRTLLDHYGLLNGRSESEINAALGTRFTKKFPGTHPDNMLKMLKNEKLDVISGENGTLELIYHYLDQNIPVIVLDSTWGGHWRLLVGYDFRGSRDSWEDNDIYIADPEHRSIEPNIDNESGLMTENEWRFGMEWYENRFYERPRDGFYIVAVPKGAEVNLYSKLTK